MICHAGKSTAEQAERHKAAGNEAFKVQQYQAAVRHYSSAIEQDPSNSVYFSNRAMAFLKVSPVAVFVATDTDT